MSAPAMKALSPAPVRITPCTEASVFACNSTQPFAQGGLALQRSVRKKGSMAYVRQSAQVLNALNTPTWDRMRPHSRREGRRFVHGVILTGAGDKAFHRGADISELAHVDAYEAEESSRFRSGCARSD